jgi:hypothetical protein
MKSPYERLVCSPLQLHRSSLRAPLQFSRRGNRWQQKSGRWNFVHLRYVPIISRMLISVRKATLFMGIIALFLQATVGFACAAQCAMECGRATQSHSSASQDHCGGHEKPGDQKQKHECNGSCQSIGSCDNITIQPQTAIQSFQSQIDVPVTLPDIIEPPIFRRLIAPGHFVTDSGSPAEPSTTTSGSRAPPVA